MGPGLVEFEHVTARHRAVTAVDGVDLSIEPGTNLAVCGSNGAGKSTLARCLLGLHPLASGEVRVDGEHPATRSGWRQRRLEVAYVPQRPSVGQFPLLVREVLESSGDLPAALAAAERLSIAHLADRPADTLSGGQLQRVMLARGVACVTRGATVLVADEPTSALDFEGQVEVAALLTGLGVTTILITHEQVVVDRCDRVVEMAQGRLRERA